tara:strand:+ start:2767 stop:3696 length:930 start_codon:yes stop_codon:yes gene_type:complete
MTNTVKKTTNKKASTKTVAKNVKVSNLTATIKETCFSYFNKDGQYFSTNETDNILNNMYASYSKNNFDRAYNGSVALGKFADAQSTHAYHLIRSKITVCNSDNVQSKPKEMKPELMKEALIQLVGQEAYDLVPSMTRSRSFHVVALIWNNLFDAEKINNDPVIKNSNYKFVGADTIFNAIEKTDTSDIVGSFYNKNTNKYVSYCSVSKKLNLTTDKKTNDVSARTSKASVGGNSKSNTPKIEKLDETKVDEQFKNQLDVFLANTKKATNCSVTDAIYTAITHVCEKAEASKVDVHALLMNMAFTFENKK